jgi:anti-sigma B factor antagonist
MLRITIRVIPEKPSLKVIELAGELDIPGSREVIDGLLPQIKEGRHDVVCDLSRVTYLNSTGIYWLMHCYLLLKERGKFFRIAGVRERIREVLDLVGFTKVVPIDRDVGAALSEDRGTRRYVRE